MIAVHRSRGQRGEPIEANRRVRNPRAERKRHVRRVELGERVVEVRNPAVVIAVQRPHETIGPVHALANNGLPERHAKLSARRGHAPVANVQVGAERRERRRRAIVEIPEHRGMLGEKRQRAVVLAGEAVAQQRRAAIFENRHDKIGGRDRPVEHRAAPHVSGERDGHEKRRGRDARV